MRRFGQSRSGLFGLTLLLGLILTAVVGPSLWPHDPGRVSGDLLAGPSLEHPLGTDDVGRDELAVLIEGARVSLTVGLATAVGSFLIGVVVGSLAGYFGGMVDAVFMRISEFFQVIPAFLVTLIVVAIIGGNIWVIVAAITMTFWPQTARVVRAQFLSIKEREYVLAAQALGFSHLYIIRNEILPNALPAAIVQSSLDMGNAILIEAGLSFLGLGDPNAQSWGEMLQRAQTYLSSAWWMSVIPGVALFFVVLAANLFGDGLNEALNPKSQER